MAYNAHNTQLEQLKIWQQNLNTSYIALHSLINNNIADSWDVIALQEPPVDKLGNSRANHQWHIVYLMHKLTKGVKPQAVTFINSKISTNG